MCLVVKMFDFIWEFEACVMNRAALLAENLSKNQFGQQSASEASLANRKNLQGGNCVLNNMAFFDEVLGHSDTTLA